MSKGEVQGLFYAPSPQPGGSSVEAVRVWCEREFSRIADVLREGGSQSLRLDVLHHLPDRPFEGAVAFFAEGVAGPERGLYEYVSGGWSKL